MIDVLLLAGGMSHRMGTDKARVTVDGQPLIARVARAVRHLGPIHIVGGSPDLVEVASSANAGAPMSHIADPDADVGPFGAVQHGAQQVSGSEILVISCDLAGVTADDVNLLVEARRSGDADLALPLIHGERQWHVLCFSSRVTPALISAYETGVRSLRRGFSGLSECAVITHAPGLVFDIDSPADLERYETGRRGDFQ